MGWVGGCVGGWGGVRGRAGGRQTRPGPRSQTATARCTARLPASGPAVQPPAPGVRSPARSSARTLPARTGGQCKEERNVRRGVGDAGREGRREPARRQVHSRGGAELQVVNARGGEKIEGRRCRGGGAEGGARQQRAAREALPRLSLRPHRTFTSGGYHTSLQPQEAWRQTSVGFRPSPRPPPPANLDSVRCTSQTGRDLAATRAG